MVYEIKNYFCDNIPTRDDIGEMIKAAAESNTVIDLHWYGPAHGYYGDDEYRVHIRPTDTIEGVMDKLPKIYAV